MNEREQKHEEYRQLRRETIGQAIEAGPQDPDPLQPGQYRMFFTRDSYLAFLRDGTYARVLDMNESATVEMTGENQFSVTVTGVLDAAVPDCARELRGNLCHTN